MSQDRNEARHCDSKPPRAGEFAGCRSTRMTWHNLSRDPKGPVILIDHDGELGTVAETSCSIYREKG
jgi:hypothetical protein